MNERKVEDPKLVIVYFANGTVQWVKSGSTNQWSREGGRVNKFFESRVYHTSSNDKIKIKQHFKLLNTVFMDVGTVSKKAPVPTSINTVFSNLKCCFILILSLLDVW